MRYEVVQKLQLKMLLFNSGSKRFAVLFQYCPRYIHEKGGSILASNIHEYYKQFPENKEVIGKFKSFCEEYPGLLVYDKAPLDICFQVGSLEA